MLRLKKGIRTETLGLPLKTALEAAARIGAQGVDINGRSEVRPAELSQTGKRQLRKWLSDFQLSVCCVSFPTRGGFEQLEGLDRRVEATKAAMMMAYDLGCPVVSVRLGLLPEAGTPARQTLLEVMQDIGRHGQRVGAVLGARTGAVGGPDLAEFIGELSPGTLFVDFDPAELLMQRHDAEAAMRALGTHVMHFRARDAVHDLARGQGVEVQLGRGSVDLPPLLAILEEHGYQGFLTLDLPPSPTTGQQYAQSLEYLDQVIA